MNIYYLCLASASPARKLSNPLGANYIMRVRGKADWYEARARALQHAAESGASRALVLHQDVSPVRVSRQGQQYAPGPQTDHGLLVYLDRLLRQYAGAVLVPPLRAVRYMRPGWEEQVPSVAMVAAYSLAAALPLDPGSHTLEYDMVARGYRVLTLSDYAFDDRGRPPVLETHGTKQSWKAAHDRALAPFF